MQAALLRSILDCFVAVSFMFWAYRGGGVRFGTEPMPDEGRAIVFVCGLLIIVLVRQASTLVTVMRGDQLASFRMNSCSSMRYLNALRPLMKTTGT